MRIAGKGLIDRDTPLAFSFDGHQMHGLSGDTLASALLANDVRLVGRSFKYHRPRGILTAGSEEPNALVTIGTGPGQEPNMRATVQELYDGLQARSQNAWPSLQFDILAGNDLLSPFLGAGFYYKTFMWPKTFWEKLYEPFIRRAAGLGALDHSNCPDTYDKAFAHCDILVIGAGPAGLMAALTSARAGADVILADETPYLGGRLRCEVEDIEGQPGYLWAEEIGAELLAMPNVRIMTRTTVTGAYDQGTYGALEKTGQHRPKDGSPLECFWRISAGQAILAGGAIERGIAFADNDRPGVMMAGAVRSYLNQYGVSPGQRVAVFGNNSDAHRTARDLAEAGVEVAAMIDSRDVTPAGDYPCFANAMVTGTIGRGGLREIEVLASGQTQVIECDALAVSGGWNPGVHLTCHMNGRPTWDEGIASFVPTPGSVPGLHVAGAANGVFSTHGALGAGVAAAKDALSVLGKSAPDIAVPKSEDAPYDISPLWAVPGTGRAWLDPQNDVTVKDVKQAAQENYRSVEHMKRYTTQGMATDQGKISNIQALAVLADATGRGIPETGTTTFRPPYSPVAIAALGAGAQGHGFAPKRLTTSHQAVLDRGAPMIEAGLWYRPSYFPRTGENTWLDSCNREVEMVRTSVGICDVSTLGKIDIRGSDAGKFLDFVYCNMFSSLKVGRVRYGLMLREDGHVLDDGTTARMGADHYVMTTTTAAAGQVMAHLDFVHQCYCADWDVGFTSVTEHWAQFAVAGPKARDLLNAVLDTEIGDENLPYMACGSIGVSGVAGRIFRISFSGEHAYEVAVPARFGDSLFRILVAQAETLGGGAYGMEALNVLRIEKGFITHAEIHGRVTADDIGMARMVSAKKDCIGKRLSQRDGFQDSDRQQLIGLRPVDPKGQILAGAHLFPEGEDHIRKNDEGYVTSTCWSPTLGTNLAMAFLAGGRDRIGEVIEVADPLRGYVTKAEVTDTQAFDPAGGRLRG